jgi:hypothetical protein
MFGEIFDASSSQSAVWAVILGALLATAGGFVATQMERIVEQRRRERNAALFFGELLTTLQIILRFTKSTHGRGDPYGPITLRMLRSAGKEIEIYDRNRESLFDLRHHHLRARIQTLVIRLTMPIESVFDASTEISNYQMKLTIALGPDTRREMESRLASLIEQRDNAFEFIMEMAAEIPDIVVDLKPLAGHDFRNADEVAAAVNPTTLSVESPASSAPAA